MVEAQKNLKALDELGEKRNKNILEIYKAAGYNFSFEDMLNGKVSEMAQKDIEEFGYSSLKDIYKKGGGEELNRFYEWVLDKYSRKVQGDIDQAQREIDAASVWTPQDVKDFQNQVAEGRGTVKELFDSFMAAFGIKYGESANKELSALQQGIQGITEDTAGALEAYMNSVSQQVYLQSDLLTQIRDVLTMYDFELQNATNAQILLSLQQSYQVQMAIQLLLTGWSNPSGNAVRVEMIA